MLRTLFGLLPRLGLQPPAFVFLDDTKHLTTSCPPRPLRAVCRGCFSSFVVCGTHTDTEFVWQLVLADVVRYSEDGVVVGSGTSGTAFGSRLDARNKAERLFMGDAAVPAARTAAAAAAATAATSVAPPLFSRFVSAGAEGSGANGVASAAVVLSPRWEAVVVPNCDVGTHLQLRMWACQRVGDQVDASPSVPGATAVAHVTHASIGGVLAVRVVPVRAATHHALCLTQCVALHGAAGPCHV